LAWAPATIGVASVCRRSWNRGAPIRFDGRRERRRGGGSCRRLGSRLLWEGNTSPNRFGGRATSWARRELVAASARSTRRRAARVLGALDRPDDQAKLLRLRRMIELGRELDFGVELQSGSGDVEGQRLAGGVARDRTTLGGGERL
jgi:hypothetical protein